MKKDTIAFLSSVAVLLLRSFGFSQSSTATKTPEFDHAALHVHTCKKAQSSMKGDGLARLPIPSRRQHVWFRIGAHEQLHIIADATDQPTRDIDVHLAFLSRQCPFHTHLTKPM